MTIHDAGIAEARVQPQVAVKRVELWVGDLEATANYLIERFAFKGVGRAAGDGGKSKVADLRCGGVRLRLRQGGSSNSRVSRHVARHGDTAVDVALACEDIDATLRRARAHGLGIEDSGAEPRIEVLDDLAISHTLHRRLPRPTSTRDNGLEMQEVDHVTYCVPRGAAQAVAEAYDAVLGLGQVDIADFRDVGGVDVGMKSYVLRSPGLKVVLTEPLIERSSGQTQMFLDAHAGPGLQHAAFSYPDLVSAVDRLRARGVDFLPVPVQYFDQAEVRLNDSTLSWEELRRLEILVDSDENGLLLQLFTRPIFDRPTLFFELIQRMGSTGFGGNNVRALFAAVQAAASQRPGETGAGS